MFRGHPRWPTCGPPPCTANVSDEPQHPTGMGPQVRTWTTRSAEAPEARVVSVQDLRNVPGPSKACGAAESSPSWASFSARAALKTSSSSLRRRFLLEIIEASSALDTPLATNQSNPQLQTSGGAPATWT